MAKNVSRETFFGSKSKKASNHATDELPHEI